MGYLVLNDYKAYIQQDYLRQLVQGDQNNRINRERESADEITTVLGTKFDMDAEFTDTLPYDRTKAYDAGTRITIDLGTNGFTAWTTLTAYAVGDLVINAAVGYICKTANSDATFTAANWTAIAARYTIFYAAYPTCTLNGQPNPITLSDPYAPFFNYKKLYSKGDIVFRKGCTYVCNTPSTTVTHQAALQYTLYDNLPYSNVFPDDNVNNANGAYWTDKTAYSVPAGVLAPPAYNTAIGYGAGENVTYNSNVYTCIADTPTPAGAFDPTLWAEISYWVEGDNRNQTVKSAMVRYTILSLSELIAPMNRPEQWLAEVLLYRAKFKDAVLGEIPIKLALKQPYNNLRTHYGGYVKNQNNW